MALVGRRHEVARIRAFLRPGAGEVALALDGSPGHGTTALMRECLALARAEGYRVLEATAAPVHRDLHYGVAIELLRPLTAGPPGRRATLLDGLDALGLLFPGLPAYRPRRSSAPAEPGLARTRVIEACRTLVTRACDDGGRLLVAVDGVGHADQASRELLGWLVRGVDRPGLRVVLASGDGGPRAPSSAARLLEGLPRTGVLAVRPLDADGTAALAAELLAGPPPHALLEHLAAHAGGVPTLVRAVVDALVRRGDLHRRGGVWVLRPVERPPVPKEVEQLAAARTAALDEPGRRLLELLGAAGGSLPHEVLAEAGPPSGTDLLDAMAVLVRDGLVEEDRVWGGGVGYRCTAPLVAEAALIGVPEVRRRETHRRLLRAWQRARPDDAPALAVHVAGAGDQLPAAEGLAVLLRALDRADGGPPGGFPVTAADVALRLARAAGRPDVLPRLHETRAEALAVAGRPEEALAAWREAAEADATGPAAAADTARRLRRAAETAWALGRTGEGLSLADASVAAVGGDLPDRVPAHGPGTARPRPGDPRHPEAVHALVTQTRMLIRTQDPRAEPVLERLAAVAADGPGGRVRSELAFLRTQLALENGRLDAAAEHAAASLARAREAGDPVLIGRGLFGVAATALERGDLRTATAVAEQGIRHAEGMASPVLGATSHLVAVIAALAAGDWDGVLERTAGLLSRSTALEDPRVAASFLAMRGAVAALRGRLPEARECLRTCEEMLAEEAMRDRQVFSARFQVLTAVAAAGDDVPALRRLVLADGRPPRFMATLAGPAGAALHRAGDTDALRGFAVRLRESVTPPQPWHLAAAAWCDGLAAALDDDPSAARWLARAAEEYRSHGFVVDAARARVTLAAAGGPASVTRQDLTADLASLTAVGARREAGQARRLLRTWDAGGRAAGGLAEGGPAGEGPARRRESGDVGTAELTRRELDVALLVAEGLSDAEVAARLVLSPRTVTTHLQHAYRRLGVRSRTELARYLMRRGLVAGAPVQPEAAASGAAPVDT